MVFRGGSPEGRHLLTSSHREENESTRDSSDTDKHNPWGELSRSMLEVSRGRGQIQPLVGECGFGIWKLGDLLPPSQKEKHLDKASGQKARGCAASEYKAEHTRKEWKLPRAGRNSELKQEWAACLVATVAQEADT